MLFWGIFDEWVVGISEALVAHSCIAFNWTQSVIDFQCKIEQHMHQFLRLIGVYMDYASELMHKYSFIRMHVRTA